MEYYENLRDRKLGAVSAECAPESGDRVSADAAERDIDRVQFYSFTSGEGEIGRGTRYATLDNTFHASKRI